MSIGINFKRKYNGAEYKIGLFIKKGNINLTANEYAAADDDPGPYINGDNIIYMALENSMNEFIPTAEFEIFDDGNAIGNILKNQNTIITLKLNKDSSDSKLELTFIVKSFDIKESDKESSIYHIYCELDSRNKIKKIM